MGEPKFRQALLLQFIKPTHLFIGVFWILACFSFTGCELIWNYSNKPGLQRDISELFRAHGVTLNQLACNMIGTSRSATCEFRLSPEQITVIVKGLNLKESKGGSLPEENLWKKIPNSKRGCLDCKSFNGVKRIKVYMSEIRAPELRLKSGSAFEYFILFQDLETDRVCIQVSYSYG
jgi:hypothetical protein